MGLRETYLEKFLSSTASDQYYVPMLDSYLYNTKGIPKGDNKIRIIIQTVDYYNNVISYTSQGHTFVGLVLFINPTAKSENLAKIINRTQTMTGWVEEHWGEELDTITLNGSTAAFIWEGPYNTTSPQGPLGDGPEQIRDVFNKYLNIPDLSAHYPAGPGDHSGLTVKNRRDTMAYDQFRKIIHLMNASTCNYDIMGLVNNRAYIQITYDYAAYKGYFESIDITENAGNPFKFNYIITFKAEQTLYSFMK